MVDSRSALENALRNLQARGEKDWRDAGNEVASRLFYDFHPQEDYLDLYFRTAKAEQTLALPPPEGHDLRRGGRVALLLPKVEGFPFVPVLSFTWSFSSASHPRGGFRLYFAHLDQLDGETEGKLRVFGLHYDDKDEDNQWHFAHVQVSDRLPSFDQYFSLVTDKELTPAGPPKPPILNRIAPTPDVILTVLLISLYGYDREFILNIFQKNPTEDVNQIIEMMKPPNGD